MSRVNEPIRTKTGWIAKALPFHKWRRPNGLASMVRDLMALRKTLILCASCEHKMPRRWKLRYDYALVKGFHAEMAACDYCRNDFTATNMYCAVDGVYHQEMIRAQRSIQETRARERAAMARDRRFLVTT